MMTRPHCLWFRVYDLGFDAPVGLAPGVEVEFCALEGGVECLEGAGGAQFRHRQLQQHQTCGKQDFLQIIICKNVIAILMYIRIPLFLTSTACYDEKGALLHQ